MPKSEIPGPRPETGDEDRLSGSASEIIRVGVGSSPPPGHVFVQDLVWSSGAASENLRASLGSRTLKCLAI
jgi:hypothetical protein